ncbi:hypothetical protein GCM10010169_02510 [Micromonospora fulviviridis]|nr:hypothetical protein GCM10010169_02510 [Micromonospora fulviviridis]
MAPSVRQGHGEQREAGGAQPVAGGEYPTSVHPVGQRAGGRVAISQGRNCTTVMPATTSGSRVSVATSSGAAACSSPSARFENAWDAHRAVNGLRGAAAGTSSLLVVFSWVKG